MFTETVEKLVENSGPMATCAASNPKFQAVCTMMVRAVHDDDRRRTPNTNYTLDYMHIVIADPYLLQPPTRSARSAGPSTRNRAGRPRNWRGISRTQTPSSFEARPKSPQS